MIERGTVYLPTGCGKLVRTVHGRECVQTVEVFFMYIRTARWLWSFLWAHASAGGIRRRKRSLMSMSRPRIRLTRKKCDYAPEIRVSFTLETSLENIFPTNASVNPDDKRRRLR